MMFRSLFGMMRRAHRVAMGDMGVMTRPFMLARLVMFCCFAMVSGREFMVFGCCAVMLGFGIAGHDIFLAGVDPQASLPSVHAGLMTLR